MINKLIFLAAIILLCIGIISVFLAREIVRRRKIVTDENIAVRNFKIFGFIVIIIALVTLYFYKLGGI